jgi:hypothetical protein
MKKIIVIVFAGLLVSAGLQAQKVCIEGGKVILDLTEGMPAGAITDVSKTTRFKDLMDHPDTGAPSAIDKLWHQENRTVGDINKTVFQKLEVAPKDMNTSGGMDGTGTMTMNWSTAFNGCINSSYDDGGWRLPTQRELMMMWIFNDALTIALPAVGGDALSSGNAQYRSATEGSATSAWFVRFGTGNTNLNEKSSPPSLRVRCVREVN